MPLASRASHEAVTPHTRPKFTPYPPSKFIHSALDYQRPISYIMFISNSS